MHNRTPVPYRIMPPLTGRPLIASKMLAENIDNPSLFIYQTIKVIDMYI